MPTTAPALHLTVGTDGTLTFIYADPLAPLLDLGEAQVRRVSNVEPAPGGGWAADMAPWGPDGAGVVLGPFALRGDALAAEVEWLEERL